MYCKNCGKELDENTNFCPNCGASQNIDSQNTQENDDSFKQYKTMSIIGFCLSCISIFTDLKGALATAGIILSVIGLINIKDLHCKEKFFALGGILIGAGSIIYTAYVIHSILDQILGIFHNFKFSPFF